MSPDDLQKVEALVRQWWLALNGGSVGSGGGPSGWLGSAFIPSSGGSSARCNIPTLVGDVDRTNRVMNALQPFERALLVEHYLVNAIAEEKARKHKMSLSSYQRWVRKAQEAFWYAWERTPHELAALAPPQHAHASAADLSSPDFFANAPWRKNAIDVKQKTKRTRKRARSIPLEKPRQ